MSALWISLPAESETLVLPWFGGRVVCGQGRRFQIEGGLPAEHGWYCFDVDGAEVARLRGPATWNRSATATLVGLTGYLAGGRLLTDCGRTIVGATAGAQRVAKLVEPGIRPFSRVRAVQWHSGDWLCERLELPLTAEFGRAFEDYKSSAARRSASP